MGSDRQRNVDYKSQSICKRPSSPIPAPSLDRPCFFVWLKMALAANTGECYLVHNIYVTSGNKTLIK